MRIEIATSGDAAGVKISHTIARVSFLLAFSRLLAFCARANSAKCIFLSVVHTNSAFFPFIS